MQEIPNQVFLCRTSMFQMYQTTIWDVMVADVTQDEILKDFWNSKSLDASISLLFDASSSLNRSLFINMAVLSSIETKNLFSTCILLKQGLLEDFISHWVHFQVVKLVSDAFCNTHVTRDVYRMAYAIKRTQHILNFPDFSGVIIRITINHITNSALTTISTNDTKMEDGIISKHCCEYCLFNDHIPRPH